jgi:hypothetical protein
MIALMLAAALLAPQEAAKLDEGNLRQLLTVRRVYVDRLGGGETASQMRDMIIASLHASKLFAVTENADRADAILRGSAEDLVYTDTLYSSEGVNIRADASSTDGGRTYSERRSRSGAVSAGDNETTRIAERRHEASASVRLVNKDGDVIWSATEESRGAKFRGASADVADKLAKRLAAEFDKAKRLTLSPRP